MSSYLAVPDTSNCRPLREYDTLESGSRTAPYNQVRPCMTTTRHLTLSDIIQAFADLGGEANWADVEGHVMKKRGSGFAPYKDLRNYKNTMFQFVQQHCEGYQKFAGDVRFERVKGTRFRLAARSASVAERRTFAPENIHPETVPEGKEYITGAVRQVLINSYERDPDARAECIRHHGIRCAVCNLSFEEQYGPAGTGFIHVHHLKPLASREVYRLDPIKDLIPVCPNCHSMLHSSDPPLSVAELRAMMAAAEARSNTALQGTLRDKAAQRP